MPDCCHGKYGITLIGVICILGMVGWCDGAGKLPVSGRPTDLDKSRARSLALAVGAGGGCLDIFTLGYHFCFLLPSLLETARYRLKYCLKGPLSPKQPTNQVICILAECFLGDVT